MYQNTCRQGDSPTRHWRRFSNLADARGGADTIETALLLSASDVTGPASFDYFVQELSTSFDIRVDGEDRPARKDARFSLRVDVRRGGRSRRTAPLGKAQADAVAAGVARLLIEGDVGQPGAWMPEQIVDPGPFLSRLAIRGLRVEFPDGASPK
jgi:hypothetical protein